MTNKITPCPLVGATIGNLVCYLPLGPSEIGRITSWNDEFVFVRYGDDLHSKATLPGDLHLMEDSNELEGLADRD